MSNQMKAANPVRYSSIWDVTLYERKPLPQTHITNGHKLIKLGRGK